MKQTSKKKHPKTNGENMVRTALQKVRTISRQQTISRQPNNKTATEKRHAVINLVYRPSTKRAGKVIQSNCTLLQSRAEVAKISSQPSMIAYKRDTNIRDMLVRSKLRQPATRTRGTIPCNPAKCRTCPSSEPTPRLLVLSPRWTSRNSSTAWSTTLYTS